MKLPATQGVRHGREIRTLYENIVCLFPIVKTSVEIPAEISDAPEWNSRDRHSILIVSPLGMHLFMASDTQRDQVFF